MSAIYKDGTLYPTGGSGSSGHTIKNTSGTALTQRSNLQFDGDFEVDDDSENSATVVTPHELTNAEIEEILTEIPGPPVSVLRLGNKFDRGDMYSTEERIIGQWIDGKPLYQKSFDWKTVANSSTSRHYIIYEDLTNLNIDSFVFAWGMWDDGDIYKSIPCSDNDYKISPVYGYPSTKDLSLVINGISYNIKAQMHIIYTKTTDTPISIGEDTDYSTEEKIVGTWIDGRPLYQCTWTGSWNVPWNNANMKGILSGVTPFLSNIKVLSAKGFGESNGTIVCGDIYIQTYSGTWSFFLANSCTLTAITIQYTKTTD